MASTNLPSICFLVLATAGSALSVQAAAPVTALVGGTVIDVSHKGMRTHDIPDAVVLMQDGRILAVGSPTGRKATN